MTASYILFINMFVAGIFAVAFVVVAATIPGSRGPRWMAWGYGTGIIWVLLQFVLARQTDPLAVGIVIFLVFQLAMHLCVIGMARHYDVEPPHRTMAAIWVLCLLGGPVILSLPDESQLRAVLYQLPYFTMQMLCAFVIVWSSRRDPIDMLLLVLQVLASFTYLARPAIALFLEEPHTPQEYIGTTYAAISQTLGSVTLIALALVLLLVMMRHTTAEMIARSETDALSGVLNRRGFEAHAERALARADAARMPAVMVAADLDHFKRINDTFGHEAGDQVIARFAAILREAAGEVALVGRLGGEEFAVLLVGANLAMGRLFAENARTTLSAADIGLDRAVTASLGVAQREGGEALYDLLRRADGALYDAKSNGRNKVSMARQQRPDPSQDVAGSPQLGLA